MQNNILLVYYSHMCVTKHTFEPLIELAVDQKQQYTLFPLQNTEIFAAYKRAVSLFWSCEELDLSADRSDFESLSPSEQHFICTVLAFFAASDALVNENLIGNFCNEVVLQEAKLFYQFQAAIEGIHSEVYSLLIDTLIRDEDTKTKLFNAVTTMPSVQAKANFLFKYMDPAQNTFAERLVAFASVEGILFSSSFASIFHFKKLNKMPGLCFSNELISRDEGQHTEFAILLHSHLQPQNKARHSRITEIIREAVSVESTFVREALKTPILGMNATAMIQYVQFIADRLLQSFGVDKYYKVVNPFQFMINQSLQGKTNFFEKRVGEYGKAMIGDTVEENNFDLNASF